MPPSSDLDIGGDTKQSIAASLNGRNADRRERRRRLPLSCGQCRNKKLSCDRSFPCQRCLRSGRPDQCSFETGTGQLPLSVTQFAQQQAQRNDDEIRDLRAEVAQLKGLLSRVDPRDESAHVAGKLRATSRAELGQAVLPNQEPEQNRYHSDVARIELSDPRERSPRGYYSQHTLLQFFEEIPQLFPFIKETTDEWLKPLGVDLKKNKSRTDRCKINGTSQEESPLQDLLPPKDDTDRLISSYLNHLEQLHRVVHVPTFKRQYAEFWVPGRSRYPAMIALILSMISISTCVSVSSGDSTSVKSKYRSMPIQWVSACDDWLRQQSPKGCKLVRYQVSCLVYLAKRFNTIRKKRFWKETGSLIQNAILDKLHCDPSPTSDSPYMGEMKRRIWSTLRELDLQNAFEYGLPSLLHNIESSVAASANLDDEDFDEACKELPIPKSQKQYTCTSYQFHSSRSWNLRLEISRRLFSTGVFKALPYEDVLQYTHELTQAIHSLPSWDSGDVKGDSSSKLPILTYSFLKFQLTECVLAIHRAYLQKDNSKFWISENACYHMSWEILLLNNKLAGLGLQSLTLLREDLLLASLNIARITLLQPEGSTSIVRTSSEATIDLLEQCLPLMEDRYLRLSNGEPWCFLTMYAAIMLLKIHVAKTTWQTAKSSCAQRFLALYYKHAGRQQTSGPNQQYPSTIFPESGRLDSSHADISIDPFDLEMELGSTWENWELAWPISSTQ